MDKLFTSAIILNLIKYSHLILDVLGVPHEPHAPKVRTRPWRDGHGPLGVAYHYTGGPSGLKTIKWFNKPSWGNTVSSCHVLIFDRCVGAIGKLWRQAPLELLMMFPVPTIVLANWRWGAWCTNWTNAETLGVEMRNCGYDITENDHGRYDVRSLGKGAELINGRHYESYTREQVASAINIGRVVKALRGDAFDPAWVIGHSAVWATKSDPGPAFPLDLVRRAIVDDQPPHELEWLEGHPEAPRTAEDDQTWWDITAESREEIVPEFWMRTAPVQSGIINPWVIQAIRDLGFNTGLYPLAEEIAMFTRWFQKSTHALTHDQHLRIDGNAGPKTRSALKRRLQVLRLRTS